MGSTRIAVIVLLGMFCAAQEENGTHNRVHLCHMHEPFGSPQHVEILWPGQHSVAVKKLPEYADMVKLEGEGAHRLLTYRFRVVVEGDRQEDTLNNTGPVRGIHQSSTFVAIYQPLPSVSFVDPYDTQKVVGKHRSRFSASVHGSVDLESIDLFAPNKTAVSLWTSKLDLVSDFSSMHAVLVDIDVGIKIHFRYPKVMHREHDGIWSRTGGIHWKDMLFWLASDYYTVNFPSFEVVLKLQNGTCFLLRTPHSVETIPETQLPTGVGRHTVFVAWATIASVVVSFLYCILVT